MVLAVEPGVYFPGRFGVRVDVFGEVSELNALNNTALAAETTDIPLALTLQVSARETTEGAEPIHATLFRNGDFTAPLTIDLTNSNPSALSAPTSVVISAGKSAVDFDLRAPTDGVVDGLQVVQLSAGAPGFIGTSTAISIARANRSMAWFWNAKPPRCTSAAGAKCTSTPRR